MKLRLVGVAILTAAVALLGVHSASMSAQGETASEGSLTVAQSGLQYAVSMPLSSPLAPMLFTEFPAMNCALTGNSTGFALTCVEKAWP